MTDTPTHQPDDITLCKSCWCATKTVEGKCGKCGAVKNQPDDELDALVRDACSVVPVSKSQYRSRLIAWRDTACREARLAEIDDFLAMFELSLTPHQQRSLRQRKATLSESKDKPSNGKV